MRAPDDIATLENNLSSPTAGVIETLAQIDGDLLILGAGGKMGPTLARMAKRAGVESGRARRVVAVSRFSDAQARNSLEQHDVETISCDLLQDSSYDRLSDIPNVVYMAGYKFGATSNPSLTWAMNCYLPALVCRNFRNSRIVVFSSGNVYGLVSASSPGSTEADELHPVGEYAATVMGRERIVEYLSRRWQIPCVLLRLNYATELRYGVLIDLAQKVWTGKPIDLTMGAVNVIWQGDANAMALQSLSQTSSPPVVLNLAGPEMLKTREVSIELGHLMDRTPQFVNQESPEALLSDGSTGYKLLGRPATTANTMIRWSADWVMRGGDLLDKPTHFESRDGKY